MGELLIVIAIIGVLAAVAFIAVPTYQRSMAQLERDGLAKQIFVAAQNHLTTSLGNRVPKSKTEETEAQKIKRYGYIDTTVNSAKDGETTETDTPEVSYIIVNNGSVIDNNGKSMFDIMLPFGAIDETVRSGGSYIIRYQQKTGIIMDVFYCSTTGTPSQYNHSLKSDDFSTIISMRDDVSEGKKSDKKGSRRNWGGAVLGWYGGTKAAELISPELLISPEIEISNNEKLSIKISDPNKYTGKISKKDVTIRLLITGLSSDASYYYDIPEADINDTGKKEYFIDLDDITKEGGHFYEFFKQEDHLKKIIEDASESIVHFIPGEDLKIQAVAFCKDKLANIAFSIEKKENSLFDSIGTENNSTIPNAAYITNIRHLENLDKLVSKLDTNDKEGSEKKLNIKYIYQSDNLSWDNFLTKIKELNSVASGDKIKIYYFENSTNQTSTAYKEDFFYPISPDYEMEYDGKYHSISGIKVNYEGNAGLFGSKNNPISVITSIQNVELIDFSIMGTNSAGALAGSLSGTEIMNVVAHNSPEKDSSFSLSNSIIATNNESIAGGLVGKYYGASSVENKKTIGKCAAALWVNGKSIAGGLIGEVDGFTNIEGCYSGGHTVEGKYSTINYNVTAEHGLAGGLIGSFKGTSIDKCYSTCSAKGVTVGGLIGYTEVNNINKCYTTGLVNGTTKFAFVGSKNSGILKMPSDNFYFEIINEDPEKDEQGKIKEFKYLSPEPLNETETSYIQALDDNSFLTNSAESEEKHFLAIPRENWKQASAYDFELVKYYQGRYYLDTVEQLGYTISNDILGPDFVRVHYGDWPAPEVFVMNASN